MLKIYLKALVLFIIYADIAGFFIKYRKEGVTKKQVFSMRVLLLVLKSPLYYFILDL